MGARSDRLLGFESAFAWSLLESVPDGIVIAAGTGDIVFVNDLAAAMFGYAPADLIDRQVEELLPEGLRSVHLAHRTRYQADPVPRAMGSGLLLSARRADGSEFPVEISLSPWHVEGGLHVMAAVRDVTDRVEADDHMRRVLDTLDATDDGVFIFDAEDLRFSYVNDGAARLVGYTGDELIGMTPLHLDRRASESSYRKLVTSLRDDPERRIVDRSALIRKDGIEVPVEETYKLAPTDHSGTQWIIALARDITDRLSAEEQLRSSELALRHAEGVLAVSADRERIARDLHDTVIQRLFGAGLNLQSAAAMADEQVRARIQIAVDDLDATIHELRTAIFSLQDRRPAPSGLRGRVLQVTLDAGGSLGFEPRVHFDGPIELIPDTLAEHLLAILREALANVAAHARATGVLVELAAVDSAATLSVTDDGVGMSDPATTGTGLANMAERAERLGGSFDIESGSDGGTRVTVRVPIGDAAPED